MRQPGGMTGELIAGAQHVRLSIPNETGATVGESVASSPLRHCRGMAPRPGLQLLPGGNVDQARRDFDQHGWRVLVLPRGISDRSSFFRGMKATCPLDPPIIRNDVWDALSDSLWNGLDGLDD